MRFMKEPPVLVKVSTRIIIQLRLRAKPFGRILIAHGAARIKKAALWDTRFLPVSSLNGGRRERIMPFPGRPFQESSTNEVLAATQAMRYGPYKFAYRRLEDPTRLPCMSRAPGIHCSCLKFLETPPLGFDMDERRRSDRIFMTIPVAIEAADTGGVAYKVDGRTVILSRYGAMIQVPRRLAMGQRVRVVNLRTQQGAFFRVVGPVTPLTEQGGQWGIEYEDPTDDIWGISFSALPTREGPNSKALLECRKCHTVAQQQVSLVELDVLETSGILLRPCERCRAQSPWGYAEDQLASSTPAEGPGMARAGESTGAAPAPSERRQRRRVRLQLPILLRDYFGGTEITQTENVSKSGFCFASAKTYFVGQGLMVACPYDAAGENLEAAARIVRQEKISEASRTLYGARYM
jgi:hypothetical protein